jgi:hypothetical protein
VTDEPKASGPEPEDQEERPRQPRGGVGIKGGETWQLEDLCPEVSDLKAAEVRRMYERGNR